MGRIFFFVIVALLIWIAWTFQRKQRIIERRMQDLERREAEERSENGGALAKEQTEMAQCEHCGIFFPASEAVKVRGHVFCSDICKRRAGY